MSIPVIYASPPSTAFYVMGVREISAVPTTSEMISDKISNTHHNHVADWMVEDDDEEEEEEEEEIEKEKEERMKRELENDMGVKSKNYDNLQNIQQNENLKSVKVTEKVVLSNIIDFTEMATHVWVDGIRDPITGRYLAGYTPFLYLTKRAINRNTNIIIDEESVAMGGRPIGILEKIIKDGVVSLQPPIIRIIMNKKVGVDVDESSKVSSATSKNSDSSDSWSSSGSGSSSIISDSRDTSNKSPKSLVSHSTEENNDNTQKNDNDTDESEGKVNDNDNDDDDEDFFGTARTIMSPRGVRIQKSSLPTATNLSLKSPITNSADKTFQSEGFSQEIFKTPTLGEVEDLRKSKKQRVVSVQARLAERQRYLSEAQQRKQSITNAAIKNKEDQTKEYMARKSSSSSAVSSSMDLGNPKIPSSSDLYSSKDEGKSNISNSEKNSEKENQMLADKKREDFSLRSVRTNSPGEMIRVVIPKEVVESVVNENDDDDDDGLWG